MISRKLYKLALWYIRKCHATDRNYRQEVEKMEWLTFNNCGKAHLIYGLGAEWENFGRYEVIDNAIQRLWEYENQPQADKWIPCSERLPEPYEKVLVCEENGEIHLCRYRDNVNRFFYDGSDWDIKLSEVIAWQPLPQPYKKEGAE